LSIPEKDLLLVSNDPGVTELVKEVARRQGFGVMRKKDIKTAVRASRDSQIVVVDCILPDGDCIECLHNLNTLNNDQVCIVFVDGTARSLGIQALKENAFFYLLKPLEADEVEMLLQRAREFQRLRAEIRSFYQCTVEDFLREKLKAYMPQIQRISGISLYDTVISEVERALIKLAMETTGGNRLRAAELLGINRNTLSSKVKKYKI